MLPGLPEHLKEFEHFNPIALRALVEHEEHDRVLAAKALLIRLSEMHDQSLKDGNQREVMPIIQQFLKTIQLQLDAGSMSESREEIQTGVTNLECHIKGGTAN